MLTVLGGGLDAAEVGEGLDETLLACVGPAIVAIVAAGHGGEGGQGAFGGRGAFVDHGLSGLKVTDMAHFPHCRTAARGR
jgi:hypothetical protein